MVRGSNSPFSFFFFFQFSFFLSFFFLAMTRIDDQGSFPPPFTEGGLPFFFFLSSSAITPKPSRLSPFFFLQGGPVIRPLLRQDLTLLPDLFLSGGRAACYGRRPRGRSFLFFPFSPSFWVYGVIMGIALLAVALPLATALSPPVFFGASARQSPDQRSFFFPGSSFSSVSSYSGGRSSPSFWVRP